MLELTQGPYYAPGEKLRRNIAEGKPGMPLALHLTVLNASTCRPVANIYRNGGSKAIVAVSRAAKGYAGAVATGVHVA